MVVFQRILSRINGIWNALEPREDRRKGENEESKEERKVCLHVMNYLHEEEKGGMRRQAGKKE